MNNGYPVNVNKGTCLNVYRMRRVSVKMSIEVAFLLGILIGNWIMLLATWRAIVRLVRILRMLEAQAKSQPSSENKVLYLPPKTDSV